MTPGWRACTTCASACCPNRHTGAFTAGPFSPDNWRCATVRKLRDLVESTATGRPLSGIALWYCADQSYATVHLGAMPLPEEQLEQGAQPLTLWLTGYKERGATEQLWLLSEGPAPARARRARGAGHFEPLRGGPGPRAATSLIFTTVLQGTASHAGPGKTPKKRPKEGKTAKCNKRATNHKNTPILPGQPRPLFAFKNKPAASGQSPVLTRSGLRVYYICKF